MARRGALEVAVTDGRGRRLQAAGLGRWLVRAAPARARGAVTVAIISDRVMRQLNRKYRRQDYATDVLSFREAAEPGVRSPRLGDIAIASGVARRQAREQGHSPAVECRLLALHGLLHLLGYDHDSDQGEMARVEDRLRRRLGLPRGLIARAPGSLSPR